MACYGRGGLSFCKWLGANQAFEVAAEHEVFLLLRDVEPLDAAQVVGWHAVGIIAAVEETLRAERLHDGLVDLAQAGIKMDIGVVAEAGLHALLAAVEHAHMGNNQ